MMRINLEEDAGRTRILLEGKLCGPWVSELEDIARATKTPLEIHAEKLQHVDQAGRYLLELLALKGARVITMLAVVLLAGTLRAETLKLSLQQAVQRAIAQNPQVQIANLNRATAQEDATIAKSNLMPQVRLDWSDVVRRGSVEANVGFAIPNVPGHVGPFQVINYGPSFGMPVFDLTLLNRWKAARQNKETAGSNELSLREQTTALVVGQYLAALRQSAAVDAAKSRVELADALLRQARNLQSAGVGTGLDTLRANQKLQVEKQSLIQQQTQLQLNLFALSKLLNLNPTDEVELADATQFFNTPAPADPEATIQLAWSSRPELKAITSRKSSAQYEETAARRDRLPKVRFDGTYGQQGTAYDRTIPAYQMGGSVSVPVFTGGRIEAQIAKAKIELKKLDQEEQDLKNQIAYEVKAAREQYRAALDEVEVANLGVTLARQEVEQSRDRFQAGVANNIEVVTAQDSLARANENQIQALYRVSVAKADLARATGRMEATYSR